MKYNPKKQQIQKSLKVGDEVVVLHSSRKDTIKAVLSSAQGTVYRVHTTTFDYRRDELQRLSEFKGTIREPQPKRARYATGTVQVLQGSEQDAIQEQDFTENPKPDNLENENPDSEISEITAPENTGVVK